MSEPAGTKDPIDPALLALVTSHDHGVLVTLKRDGRPQLSTVGYAFDLETVTMRISVTDSRAKTRNLRRDPRCSFFVTTEGMGPYVVLEGTAQLTPVAADPHDATVDALVDLYRAITGKDHPDWDEYRAAMVADGRLVLSFVAERAYGMSGR
jgi:PPOX class probable F420-dependent enzyme